MLFKHIWIFFTLAINQKEESTNYLPFSGSHYSPTPLLYTVQLRIHRPKIRNTICIYLLFFAGSGTNNSGSGSKEKFRSRPDTALDRILLETGYCLRPDTAWDLILLETGYCLRPDTAWDWILLETGNCLRPVTAWDQILLDTHP